MNAEQKRVYDIIVTTGMVPLEYDFVVVNKALARGINIIDKRFDNVIIDSFDAADLNFFVPMITNAIEAEDGTIKVVGDFWQLNYNVDNDTLVEASGGSMPALLTMEKAEDGSLTVTEGRVAQDGEGNWADIESFCEEIGTTTDEYLAATNENNRELSLDSMILEYIGEHPEITRIEKNGSILSADDLQAEMEERFETMLMAIFAVFSDEEPVESMTEESMTEADL